MGVRVVTFKIDTRLLRELEHVASLRGLNRSEAIRQAISLYISLAEYMDRPVDYKVVRLLA